MWVEDWGPGLVTVGRGVVLQIDIPGSPVRHEFRGGTREACLEALRAHMARDAFLRAAITEDRALSRWLRE